MARINVDDDIEHRREFWKLVPLVGGDHDVALGRLVRFFRLAQKLYAHDEVMTERELIQQCLAEMIPSGWAVPAEVGFQPNEYCRVRFGWLKNKVEAGKARAKGQRRPDGTFGPPAETSGDQQAPAETSSDQSPAPALSPAPAPANATAGGSARPRARETGTTPSGSAAPPGEGERRATEEERQVLREAYTRVLRVEYGSGLCPIIDTKGLEAFDELMRRYTLKQAVTILETYCSMDIEKEWFRQQSHNLATLLKYLPRVHGEAQRRHHTMPAQCPKCGNKGTIGANHRSEGKFEIFICGECTYGKRDAPADCPTWTPELEREWDPESREATA